MIHVVYIFHCFFLFLFPSLWLLLYDETKTFIKNERSYVLVGPVFLGEYLYISVGRSVGDDHYGAVTLGASFSHVHLAATQDHTHTRSQSRATRAQPRHSQSSNSFVLCYFLYLR